MKYPLSLISYVVFICLEVALPQTDAFSQGALPELGILMAGQSNAFEGGCMVRCLTTSTGTCRTFQVIYSDGDGDFPLRHDLRLRHYGTEWPRISMETTDSLVTVGLEYCAEVEFSDTGLTCELDTAFSGWEYMFDFEDVDGPATNINGRWISIPYLTCPQIPTCVDSGATMDIQITYHNSDGTHPSTNKWWHSMDGGLNWIPDTLAILSGIPEQGLRMGLTVRADSSGGVLCKFDLNDGMSKPLGAATWYGYSVKPLVNPFAIVANGHALEVEPWSPGLSAAWLYEGNPLPEQQGNAHPPQLDGSYSVTVTDSNGCTYVCPAVYTVIHADGGVGIILEIDIDGVGEVFPNPSTTGRLIFQTDWDVTDVQFIDRLGRTTTLQPKQSTGIVEVDMAGLAPGMYIMRVVTAAKSANRRILLLR